jgi:2-C-methyl-D-erythritol 4-phosphate cytidylyltransferase
MNYLIIVAGGNGERMSSKDNKIFLEIEDRSIIYWTLKAFEKNSTINAVVVSARVDDQEKLKDIIAENNFKKVIGIVSAEKSRQESVLKALVWLKAKARKDDLVGVHNAANPFVLQKEIKDVFTAARIHRAALLAHPARDTIKITSNGNSVNYTPMRTSCWCAQTPQVASYQDLLEASMKAKNENFIGTDDTQLLEIIKIKSKVIPCSRYNFKITFPEDLILAKEILLKFRKEDEICLESD